MNNNWIPIAESLPGHMGAYLVTVETKVFHKYHSTDIAHYIHRKWYYAHSGTEVQGSVIAWMPLPDPYVEGRNNPSTGDKEEKG